MIIHFRNTGVSKLTPYCKLLCETRGHSVEQEEQYGCEWGATATCYMLRFAGAKGGLSGRHNRAGNDRYFLQHVAIHCCRICVKLPGMSF